MDDDPARFDPARPVWVLADGHWWPGRQTDWVRWPDGTWRATCTWSQGAGSSFIKGVPADRVRLRTE